MGTERVHKPGLHDVISRAMGDPLPALGTTKAETGSPSQPRSYQPAVDVKETRQEYEIFVDLPGIDEDALHFQWEGKTLLMSGCRDFDHDREDAEDYVRLERPYGEFRARIEFSEEVDADQATAKYKRGVLRVRLPKRSRIEKGVSLA